MSKSSPPDSPKENPDITQKNDPIQSSTMTSPTPPADDASSSSFPESNSEAAAVIDDEASTPDPSLSSLAALSADITDVSAMAEIMEPELLTSSACENVQKSSVPPGSPGFMGGVNLVVDLPPIPSPLPPSNLVSHQQPPPAEEAQKRHVPAVEVTTQVQGEQTAAQPSSVASPPPPSPDLAPVKNGFSTPWIPGANDCPLNRSLEVEEHTFCCLWCQYHRTEVVDAPTYPGWTFTAGGRSKELDVWTDLAGVGLVAIMWVFVFASMGGLFGAGMFYVGFVAMLLPIAMCIWYPFRACTTPFLPDQQPYIMEDQPFERRIIEYYPKDPDMPPYAEDTEYHHGYCVTNGNHAVIHVVEGDLKGTGDPYNPYLPENAPHRTVLSPSLEPRTRSN